MTSDLKSVLKCVFLNFANQQKTQFCPKYQLRPICTHMTKCDFRGKVPLQIKLHSNLVWFWCTIVVVVCNVANKLFSVRHIRSGNSEYVRRQRLPGKAICSWCIMGKYRYEESARNRNHMVTNVTEINDRIWFICKSTLYV